MIVCYFIVRDGIDDGLGPLYCVDLGVNPFEFYHPYIAPNECEWIVPGTIED